MWKCGQNNRIYSNCWSSGGGKGKLLFWLFRPAFRGRREIIRISYWLILGGVGISLFAHHVALLLGRLHKPCLGERIPCFIPPLRPKTYHPLPTRYSPSLWKTSLQVYVSPSPSSKSLFRRSFGPHQNILRFQTCMFGTLIFWLSCPSWSWVCFLRPGEAFWRPLWRLNQPPLSPTAFIRGWNSQMHISQFFK